MLSSIQFKEFEGVCPIVIKGKTTYISNCLFDILKILWHCREKDFLSRYGENKLRALIIILVSIFAWVLLSHRTLTTPWMDQSSLKCTPWWRTAIFARYIESQWFGKRDSKASSEFFVLEQFIESPLTPLSVKYAWERSGMVLYDISKISGGCTIWRNISTENSRHCQCDSGNLGAII